MNLNIYDWASQPFESPQNNPLHYFKQHYTPQILFSLEKRKKMKDTYMKKDEGYTHTPQISFFQKAETRPSIWVTMMYENNKNNKNTKSKK